ncbi:MAG: tRNA uridine(34) 5-carboxymethylaminomethyl modification radical SAM/GNAT enzyme Elp3 [Anaerolineae bacterium]|nr:tRNA uridine(34) 5-carboxymethylaminomethyl modification radical SAM/GNAT enzyme Elp3 [Anaerolineae bacterium]
MLAAARAALEDIRAGVAMQRAVLNHPLPGGGVIGKHVLVAAYRQLVAQGDWEPDDELLAAIRMKPVRSLSGVTTVTVLTMPYPCPGTCIFCPTQDLMPKSYLPDEPGAARAVENRFDPFDQVRSRLEAYHAVGHPTDKIELLILGGTFDAYRRDYQEWFVRRCFDAMNGFDSANLAEAQRANETAAHRNVGLVVETRPDEITLPQLRWLRTLGVTKLQIGAQSLDDDILARNRRGHTTTDLRNACTLLRAAGFKIVLHWMPNLLGATPQSDRADFARLWLPATEGLGLCPDELKIYPTQLLAGTELYNYWQRGEYVPYTTEELIDLIASVKTTIPPYCRVNRIIRDIPSTHVVAGNRRTSLRQDALAEVARRGERCRCIRCREVRSNVVESGDLRLVDEVYHPAEAEEHFLSYVTPDDHIAGYLRLSLTNRNAAPSPISTDLADAALIREVHVYGQALPFGGEQSGAAQHSGLGTRLLEQARALSRQAGYSRLAVIAAVGTRLYYEKRGFRRGEMYLVQDL